MEKSINDYIRELQEMQSRSRFQQAIPVVTDTAPSGVVPPTDNTNGILIITARQSQNTLPVRGARFTVSDKNGNIMSEGNTDMSGKSPPIVLPAIPRTISEQPGAELLNSAIFYDAEMELENYIPLTIKNISIFEGVTTLHNFDMTFMGASPDGRPIIITLPTENNL